MSRFAFVRTRANPGASAPLGWTLSADTFDGLRDQLALNAEQFGLIDTWLTANLVCAPIGS